MKSIKWEFVFVGILWLVLGFFPPGTEMLKANGSLLIILGLWWYGGSK